MSEKQKYEMPFEGQAFYRETRAGVGFRERAMVTHIQEIGEVKGVMQWVAFISHVDGMDRIDHNSIIGKESWRPIPFKEREQRYGEGYSLLRGQIVVQNALILRLEERLEALERTPPVAVTEEAPAPAPPSAEPKRKTRDIPTAPG